MGVSGQLHAPAALSLGKSSWEEERDEEQELTLRRREKSFALAGSRTPDCPALNLITILTELSQNQVG
jgi:hypothetical protein